MESRGRKDQAIRPVYARISRGCMEVKLTLFILARKSSLIAAPLTPVSPTIPAGFQPSALARDVTKDGVTFSIGDNTRNKCAELVYNSLAFDSGARTFLLHLICIPLTIPSASEQIKEKAVKIEANTYKEHNNSTTGNYKIRIRSLFTNLKDRNNPGLREKVVSGELTVDRFTTMTVQVRDIELHHSLHPCLTPPCRRWLPMTVRLRMPRSRRRICSNL